MIALRLRPGDSIPADRDALIVDLSGRELRFLTDATAGRTIPVEGAWYSVSTAPLHFSCASERMLPYFDDTFFPGRTFRLAFKCDFTARVAHVAGLRRWLNGRDELTTDGLTRDLQTHISSALKAGVGKLSFPERPHYELYTQAQADIAKASGTELFWTLYENGLCLDLASVRIGSFEKKFAELFA